MSDHVLNVIWTLTATSGGLQAAETWLLSRTFHNPKCDLREYFICCGIQNHTQRKTGIKSMLFRGPFVLHDLLGEVGDAGGGEGSQAPWAFACEID